MGELLEENAGNVLICGLGARGGWIAENWGMEAEGVLLAVDDLGPKEMRGLVGRGLGGGKEALKPGSRLLTPPVAAFRNRPALFLIPGEAVFEMASTSLGTGASNREKLGLAKLPEAETEVTGAWV